MSAKRFIPVAAPTLNGNEKKYVTDCLDSSWISSNGSYIPKFEKAFAEFSGTRYAESCFNGTVALHLALLALGVQPGDEVIVPTLTFVATPNTVVYCGAKPVFVDCEPETWNMDPAQIEAKITPQTKGIIVVHIYGHPVDMDPVIEIARKHNLFIIEDAAEAHGAKYKDRKVGALGDIATFSFYANKIITTGEGGIVVTNREDLALKVNQLKDQGYDPNRKYWFPVLGYNYRMINLQAAIGLAQLENADWHLARHRENALYYSRRLSQIPGLKVQPEMPWACNVYWINCLVLDDRFGVSRDDFMAQLYQAGIETRPFFYPMHTLPMYREMTRGQEFPVADYYSSHGLNLPSSASLTEEDLGYVCSQITRILQVKGM